MSNGKCRIFEELLDKVQEEDTAVREAVLLWTAAETAYGIRFDCFWAHVYRLFVSRFTTHVVAELVDDSRMRAAQAVKGENVTSVRKHEVVLYQACVVLTA